MIPIDNRHAIRNPFGPGPMDMEIFAKTLKVTRIPDLFRTSAGLAGHARQIEQECNRLNDVEGRSQQEVIRAVLIAKELRSALLKSKQAAVQRGFVCNWHGFHRV